MFTNDFSKKQTGLQQGCFTSWFWVTKESKIKQKICVKSYTYNFISNCKNLRQISRPKIKPTWTESLHFQHWPESKDHLRSKHWHKDFLRLKKKIRQIKVLSLPQSFFTSKISRKTFSSVITYISHTKAPK